jgi:hypothetical protein
MNPTHDRELEQPVQACFAWHVPARLDEQGNDPTPKTRDEARERGREAALRGDPIESFVYDALVRWGGCNIWQLSTLTAAGCRGFIEAEGKGAA